MEHLRENIKLKDNLNNSNMIIILDSLYKYIDSQKKDKKNATIKLQVINEYLSVAWYKNIDNTQKIKNNFVSNVKDKLQNGSIISITINDSNKSELPILINYIISKGYEIKTLNVHLSE